MSYLLCATPETTAHQAPPSLGFSRQEHFPSIRIFSNELLLCIRWPKYWTFSISPLSEYSGLISFRIDWFHLLVVQGISGVFSSSSVQKHQFFSAQWRKWFIILNVFNRTEQCAVLDTYNSRISVEVK